MSIINTNEVSVVFDNGTSLSKIGLSNLDFPDKVFPTHRNNFSISKNPIKKSVIVDFDEITNIWIQSYNDLGLSNVISEYPLLLSEVPYESTSNKSRKSEILFELFNIPKAMFVLSAELSLYSSGNVTGTVLECGDGSSHIVSIFEGQLLPNSIHKYDISGNDITNEYIKYIELNCSNSVPSISSIAKEIKETYSFVAFDYDIISNQIIHTEIMNVCYKLPDGTNIKLDDIRYEATEILFNPRLIGKEFDGLPQEIYKSICSCEIDLRRQLYNNVIVSGGTTLLPGYIERFQKEIIDLVPQSIKVNVTGTLDRMYGAWIGGSIVASHDSFQDRWISKAKFDEYGINALIR